MTKKWTPYPYPCGYDPRGKPLKEVVAHWKACEHERCKQMARDLELTKRSLQKR